MATLSNLKETFWRTILYSAGIPGAGIFYLLIGFIRMVSTNYSERELGKVNIFGAFLGGILGGVIWTVILFIWASYS